MNYNELKYIFLTSVLLSLGFPPFPLGILTPFALAIFIFFLRDKTPGTAFRLGYWLGLVWGALSLFWIAASTLPGALVAILVNSLHYAVVWWLFTILRRKNKHLALLSLPFIWVGFEYIRLFSDIRFNWLTLAYTQTYNLPFIQIAHITGYLGVSFILLVIAVLLYYLLIMPGKRKWIPAALILLIVTLNISYGVSQINELNNKEYTLARAALVQPNVDPFQKWDPDFQKQAFAMLMKASEDISARKPEIIVWPETATPFYLRARPVELRTIQHFVDSTGINLLTGTPDFRYLPRDDDYLTYNAAFFFGVHADSFQTYYKMALVPAAESMPFKNVFPFLRKVNVGGGDFFSGKRFSIFRFPVTDKTGRFRGVDYQVTTPATGKIDTVALSAIICYESVFPNIVRKFIEKGANMLTIITNDGWFGMTSGPYQHFRYAIFRAVENRVSIIRCANTGISGFIDPAGHVLAKAALNTRQDLEHYLPLRNQTTFYTRHGEWPGKISLIVSLLLFFIILSVGLKQRLGQK